VTYLSDGGGLAAAGGGRAGGGLLEGAESFVDGFGVGEGVEKVGGDQDEVGSLLHAVEVFAADAFAEVEIWTRCEGIEFRILLHIDASHSLWRGGLR
jgi:hypothetical protein